MGGGPVIIKDVQFSAACPITETPRMLQLKFSATEGVNDPIEFKITSTTGRYLFSLTFSTFILSEITLILYKFDNEVPWTLHCRGVVQRREAITDFQPLKITTKPERFSNRLYTQKEFYGRIPDDKFQYLISPVSTQFSTIVDCLTLWP
jgi:hypothetical protein